MASYGGDFDRLKREPDISAEGCQSANPSGSNSKSSNPPKSKNPTSTTKVPPVARQQKQRARRLKANTRERNRMHGLNAALDILRGCVPLSQHHQKLSKIETLRLARNYINILTTITATGQPPSALEYARALSVGMSQTTTNLIANCLQVHPRLLMSEQHFFFRPQPSILPPPPHPIQMDHHHTPTSIYPGAFTNQQPSTSCYLTPTQPPLPMVPVPQSGDFLPELQPQQSMIGGDFCDQTCPTIDESADDDLLDCQPSLPLCTEFDPHQLYQPHVL